MTYDSQQANISTLCPNNATCVQVRALPDGWYDLTDTKDPGSPVLHFDTAELDAFAAAWLAGKWGNDPAALLEQITEVLRKQLAADILGLKQFYDDNVHARLAIGFAADIARGTKVELRADATKEPTPCGPTPNALICACGLPLHHDRGAHEPIGELDT